MNLYELTGSYLNLLQLTQDGEIDEQAIADTLASLEDAIDQKAEGIAKVMRSNSALIDALKAEEKRLAERRKALENRNESLKQYLASSLEAIGVDKVKTATHTIGFRNNPPAVSVLDEAAVPLQYFITTQSLDKKSILEQLKNGEEIPGVTLTVGRSLQIR
ncbi:siphovirus Gp157 family protein [Brevibacillus centrosporus]|uniref:siphovirus Gp157 family protein n=1 Tax=Brevibacillus centrosporus TaxID=54910 RepID=UPI002E2192B0|nr:siphovirus Gp157 family protein [Brevibacillus centrosporus]